MSYLLPTHFSQFPSHNTSPVRSLSNVRLVGLDGFYKLQVKADGCLGAIAAIEKDAPIPAGDTPGILDFEGDWLSLGGVDLQINGALGIAFPDLQVQHAESLHKICQFLWQQGVNAFLPTLVTTSVAKIHAALDAIAVVMAEQAEARSQTEVSPEAQILGSHLEGPFLNPEKRGAHPAEYLLSLSAGAMAQLLAGWEHVVKLVTLAPELDETGEAIAWLRSRGIAVSLGHSQSTASQAQAAFQQGATLVTHAFNAMPGIHHRQPGLLGVAILDPRVYCGLIADGQHVDPLVVELLLRASLRAFDRTESSLPSIFLVSDALAPLGLPDGRYPWDSREIDVKAGTARLLDGTLSGTTLSLLAGVTNLVQWGICDPETAIALATLTPRMALDCFDQTASDPQSELSASDLRSRYLGQPLNTLLRWHWDGNSLHWQRVST